MTTNWKAHYKTTEIWNDTEGTVTTLCSCHGNYRNDNELHLFEEKPTIKL
jgi:hypothetical protein